MNIRPFNRLLLAAALTALPVVASADDTEDITVYGKGEDANSLYQCLITDLPTISFTDGTISIMTSKDANCASFDLSQVSRIVFGVKPATPAFELGDVNCDGSINVVDIATVIAVTAGAESDDFKYARADVNSDGVVDVADIASIIAIMASQASILK